MLRMRRSLTACLLDLAFIAAPSQAAESIDPPSGAYRVELAQDMLTDDADD
jgi:hypothetical protein